MEPNVKSPCSCGEHQAKEIDGASGIPQSFQAVLHHKRFWPSRLKNPTPEAYTLKLLRVPILPLVKALFRSHGPPQAKGIGGAIVLTLHGIDLASIVETEHFIAHVQKRGYTPDSLINAIAALGIELGVRVKVVVAAGPRQTKYRIVRRPASGIPLIGGNALIVMADGEAPREPAFVIGEIEVVIVGRVAIQRWFI